MVLPPAQRKQGKVEVNPLSGNFYDWIKTTGTKWWIDSAAPHDISGNISNGIAGVTTNPLLLCKSLYGQQEQWKTVFDITGYEKDEKIQAIIKKMVTYIAHCIYDSYKKSNGAMGYVCAQTNPQMPEDYEAMLKMAKKFHSWAPNIAVKLPGTAAGIRVMEDCTKLGITTVVTTGFSVAQNVHVAERYRQALKALKEKTDTPPGKCFSVIMIGRLDDYLRDVSQGNSSVSENDIQHAGVAVAKKIYQIFQDNQYEAVLLASGFRTEKQAMELLGGALHLSLSPDIAQKLNNHSGPYENRINIPVKDDVIKRLSTINEFKKAYDIHGLAPQDFISYGALQRTLHQFEHEGWLKIGDFDFQK